MKRIIIITAMALVLSGLCATAGDAAAPGRKGKSGAGERGADVKGAGEHKGSPPYIRCDKNGNRVIDADEYPEKSGKLGKGGENKGKGGPGDGGEGMARVGPGKTDAANAKLRPDEPDTPLNW